MHQFGSNRPFFSCTNCSDKASIWRLIALLLPPPTHLQHYWLWYGRGGRCRGALIRTSCGSGSDWTTSPSHVGTVTLLPATASAASAAALHSRPIPRPERNRSPLCQPARHFCSDHEDTEELPRVFLAQRAALPG